VCNRSCYGNAEGLRPAGSGGRGGAHSTAGVGDEREGAAIHLSLHRGGDSPALDIQLAETLRDARATGRAVVRVYADVAGALLWYRRVHGLAGLR
jgi:hypothetical protein